MAKYYVIPDSTHRRPATLLVLSISQYLILPGGDYYQSYSLAAVRRSRRNLQGRQEVFSHKQSVTLRLKGFSWI